MPIRPNHKSCRASGQLVVLDVSEKRAETLDGAEDHIAHDGGDKGGKERLHLEVVPVHDLGGEHRTAEGGAEDRADS